MPITKTTSTKTNGIIITGFITIGNPNVTGSLILKIPAGKANLPSVLKDFSFERVVRSHEGLFLSFPPRDTNHGMKPVAVI